MEYRTYVESCPQISAIGFGAWQLGNKIDWKGLSDLEGVNLVRSAMEEGINFFDTAPGYGLGSSEELLGKAIKGVQRENLVISTKFGHHSDGHTDFSAKKLRTSVEGSLKRLNTEYIDSVLLHNPPKEVLKDNHQEHYEILEALKQEGKIKAYGASLDSKEEMEIFMANTKGQVIEAFFNILHQDVRYAFKTAGDKGIRIIAKIPLDSGWLTGKYHENSVFEGVRVRWSKEDIKIRAGLVNKLRELPSSGQTLAQFALKYCLGYEEVATVIPGAVSTEQLLANVNALTYTMSKNTIEWLENFYEKEVRALHLVW